MSKMAQARSKKGAPLALLLPSEPPRRTRDGDLPDEMSRGASLQDRRHVRTIEVTSVAYGNEDGPGANERAGLTVRWRAYRDTDGEQYQELEVAGERGFRCAAHHESMAVFEPAHPHILRGLATLLTELADRVEADRAAYELLEQIRR